jgi:hypothetical protein
VTVSSSNSCDIEEEKNKDRDDDKEKGSPRSPSPYTVIFILRIFMMHCRTPNLKYRYVATRSSFQCSQGQSK